MNTKVALGIVAWIIVVIIVLFFIYPTSSPNPVPTTVSPQNTTASTAPQTSPPRQPAKTSSQPTFKMGTPTAVQSFARFDASSLISTSAYPVITGTANVPKVGLTIYTSEGVGIVRPGEVLVSGGHWSYPSSVALAPGTYMLILTGGSVDVTAKLIVNNP